MISLDVFGWANILVDNKERIREKMDMFIIKIKKAVKCLKVHVLTIISDAIGGC